MPGSGTDSTLDDAVARLENAVAGLVDAAAPGGEDAPAPKVAAPAEVAPTVYVGVGWVASLGSDKTSLPGAPASLLDFVAKVNTPCAWLRGDTTCMGLPIDDFLPHGNNPPRISAAALVILTGHGDAMDFFLPPGQGAVSPTGPVKFGGGLRWLILTSCSVFEDGGGHTPLTWGGMFDGLHVLIGAAAFVQPSSHRSQKFARYLNDGVSVIDAWWQALRESGDDNPGAWGYIVPSKAEAVIRHESLGQLASPSGGDLNDLKTFRSAPT